MHPDDPESLHLDKLDVARRQIETAVYMWFQDMDAVSVHTLVAASGRVVLDMAAHLKIPTRLLDTRYIKPGMEKEYKKLMRQAETFFKHAKEDPDATLIFWASGTEYYLYDVISCYKDITEKRTALMLLFSLRFQFTHPRYFSESYLKILQEQIGAHYADIHKTEFYDALFQSCKDAAIALA